MTIGIKLNLLFVVVCGMSLVNAAMSPETPTVTGTPETKPSPSVTDNPEVTSTPSVTNNPEVKSTPSVTDNPEVTSTPSVSVIPEVTSTQSVTDTPSTTLAPKFCEENTCQNGGRCRNGPPGWCACRNGWTGDLCDEDHDECAGEKPVCKDHEICKNLNGTYDCVCDGKYKLFIGRCIEKFMLPLGNLKPVASVHGRKGVVKDWVLPEAFPYFDQGFMRTINAYTDGYVSFDDEYQLNHAPSPWPNSPPLFSVYWSDLDMSYWEGGLSVHQENRAGNVSESGPIISFVTDLTSQQPNYADFQPVAAICVTWKIATPYPFEQYFKDLVQAQLILATDTVQTLAIRSYDVTWAKEDVKRRPSVSFDYTGSQMTKVEETRKPEPGKGGNFITVLTEPAGGKLSGGPFKCFKNILEENDFLNSVVLPACPCYKQQADVDFSFEADSRNNRRHCYRSIFPTPEGWTQRCCYDDIVGALIKQSKDAWYPENEKYDEIKNAYDSCCGDSHSNGYLCRRFYDRYPSNTCSGYQLVKISGGFGDPHIVNTNGYKFTFNGVGEYNILTRGQLTFHGRTTDSGKKNTTLFNGFSVQVGVSCAYTVEMEASNATLKHGGECNSNRIRTRSDVNGSKVTFVFITGKSFETIQVELKNQSLSYTVGLKSVKGATGLHASEPGAKSSGKDINDFAEKWRVKSFQGSTFPYKNESTWLEDNDQPNFNPAVVPANVEDVKKSLDDGNLVNQTTELCANDLFCWQDFFVNRDAASAKETLKTGSDLEKEEEMMDKIREKSNLEMIPWEQFAVTPKTVTKKWSAKNAIEKLNFRIEKPGLPGISIDNETGVVQFDINIDTVKNMTFPGQLVLVAENDELYFPVKYQPELTICMCDTCFTKQFMNEDGNVHLLPCDCPKGTEGQFCEGKVNPCVKCPIQSQCNSTAENLCECSHGFQLKTVDAMYTCTESNECLLENGGCEQICQNTVGGRNCTCLDGYTSIGTRCDDIAECAEEDICPGKASVCHERPGSYSCECPSGFYGEDCFRASKPFPIKTTIKAVWHDDLSNSASENFLKLSTQFEKTILSILNDGSSQKMNQNNTDVKVSKITKKDNDLDTKMGRVRRMAPMTSAIVVASDVITNQLVDSKDLQMSLHDGLKNYEKQDRGKNKISFQSEITVTEDGSCGLCDDKSSTCSTNNQSYVCNCRDGYEKIVENPSRCQDIDECQTQMRRCGDFTCTNTAGSYQCDCLNGHYWDSDGLACVDPCAGGIRCQNDGMCYGHGTDFRCSCTYGWEGKDCSDEQSEAKDREVVIICVSVILGVLILFLIVVIIIMYRRQIRTTESRDLSLSSSGTESAAKVYDYDAMRSIPRPKLLDSSKDEDQNYKRLQHVYDSVGAVKGSRSSATRTYDNNAYDSASDRL